MIDYSVKLVKKEKKYGLNPQEMAYISLIYSGWHPKDALLVTGIIERAGSYNIFLSNQKRISEKVGYKKYITDDEVLSKRPMPMDDEDDDPVNDETQRRIRRKKLRNKDAVLIELEKVLPSLKGKERVDVIMKIADLQQMKKGTTKDKDDDLVQFFLPLTCNYCSLFMNHMKNKDNNVIEEIPPMEDAEYEEYDEEYDDEMTDVL